MGDLNQFYNEVLTQFIKKLERQYRFRDSLTENDINKLHKTMFNKLNDPQQSNSMLLKGLPYKQRVDKKKEEEIIAKIQEPSYSQRQEDQKDQDEEQDDLKHFQLPIVKQQQKDSNNYPNNSEKFKDESDYSGDDDKNFTEEIIHSKTYGHIIGTYSIRNKKHIPKYERTKIDLENVFVRFYNQKRQLYYPKLLFEYGRLEKSDIKY